MPGTQGALQDLLEDLRITLIVVQRGPRRRQTLDPARLEAALTKPVGGAGGQHEQAFDAGLTGAAQVMTQLAGLAKQ